MIVPINAACLRKLILFWCSSTALQVDTVVATTDLTSARTGGRPLKVTILGTFNYDKSGQNSTGVEAQILNTISTMLNLHLIYDSTTTTTTQETNKTQQYERLING